MSNKKKWKKVVNFNKQIESNKKDTIYNSYWLLKFLNKLIKKGKKHKSEKLFYNILYKIKTIKHPLKLYFNIILKSKFLLNTQLKRLGKYFYKIPYLVKFPQNYKSGISKIINTIIIKRTGKNLTDKIYFELLNIYFNPKLSNTLISKKQTYKIVQKNRAFMHFRW